MNGTKEESGCGPINSSKYSSHPAVARESVHCNYDIITRCQTRDEHSKVESLISSFRESGRTSRESFLENRRNAHAPRREDHPLVPAAFRPIFVLLQIINQDEHTWLIFINATVNYAHAKVSALGWSSCHALRGSICPRNRGSKG